MPVLGIDTATANVSMGIVDGQKLVGELTFPGNRQHLRQLIPWIDYLLQQSNTSLQSIDCLACVRGPGSFTGLRIGLATIQGLCLALAKPAIGFCSLEVFARSVCYDQIWVLLLSRADIFFYACYCHGVLQGNIEVAKAEAIEHKIPWGSIVVSPDGDKLPDQFHDPERYYLQNIPTSGARVAMLGENSYHQGKTVDPMQLAPDYLCASFAEKKKHAHQNS